MRHSMRTSDFAFRIGGDEFALLLPQADAEQAGTLGRRIHTKFAGVLQPLQLEIPLGLDYGLAVYPQDGDQAEVLLRIADERLYQMKNSARTQAETDAAARPEWRSILQHKETRPALTVDSAPAGTRVEKPSAAHGDEGILCVEIPKVNQQWRHVRASCLSLIKRCRAAQPLNGASGSAFRWQGKRALRQSGTGGKPLRVLDMSHGGVALEAGENVPLGESFQAVLQVPILGEVRVKLKKLYVHHTVGQQARVGCLFIT